MNREEMAANCMEMIGYAGEGRSLVYEAVDLLVEEEYQAALEVVIRAEDELLKAHEIQFMRLMSRQADDEELPADMLLLHAMDILMAATSEKDLVKAIVQAKIRKRKRTETDRRET
jgi:Phosphotransferase system cellobiose-specific component IIA